MSEYKVTEKILQEKKFPNGIKVGFYDLSRKVAADRWLVKVRCEASLELGDDAFQSVEDENLVDELKRKFDGEITHVICKERNFIDEKEKDAVLSELLTQLQENVCAYLGGERFPQRLLQKKIADFQTEFELARRLAPVPAEPDEDDEGPADFSACFRD